MTTLRMNLEFKNAVKTQYLKPKDPQYNSWIDFWCDKTENNKPNNCCVVNCIHQQPITQGNIIGGHVYITKKISNKAEQTISWYLYINKILKLMHIKENKVVTFQNIKILLRHCDSKRVLDNNGNPIFIAPICNACNQLTNGFSFVKDTIIIPLYEEDQIDVNS